MGNNCWWCGHAHYWRDAFIWVRLQLPRAFQAPNSRVWKLHALGGQCRAIFRISHRARRLCCTLNAKLAAGCLRYLAKFRHPFPHYWEVNERYLCLLDDLPSDVCGFRSDHVCFIRWAQFPIQLCEHIYGGLLLDASRWTTLPSHV